MTLKESYDILKEKKFPKKPSKCIEYVSCFVYHFGGDKQLDFMFAVDKNTKEVRPFTPKSISPGEFSKPLKTYNFT